MVRAGGSPWLGNGRRWLGPERCHGFRRRRPVVRNRLERRDVYRIESYWLPLSL